jgi:hypothetical protein
VIYLLGVVLWWGAMLGSIAYGPYDYYKSGKGLVFAAEVAVLWPIILPLTKFGIKPLLPFAPPVWDTSPPTSPQQGRPPQDSIPAK